MIPMSEASFQPARAQRADPKGCQRYVKSSEETRGGFFTSAVYSQGSRNGVGGGVGGHVVGKGERGAKKGEKTNELGKCHFSGWAIVVFVVVVVVVVVTGMLEWC